MQELHRQLPDSLIFQGIFFSLSGPTLLYLTENVNATVGQVSSMFTGRSAGYFVGSIIFGMIKNRYKTHKPLTVIGEFYFCAFGFTKVNTESLLKYKKYAPCNHEFIDLPPS